MAILYPSLNSLLYLLLSSSQPSNSLHLKSWPEQQLHSIEVVIKARDAPLCHDLTLGMVDPDHEQHPEHVPVVLDHKRKARITFVLDHKRQRMRITTPIRYDSGSGDNSSGTGSQYLTLPHAPSPHLEGTGQVPLYDCNDGREEVSEGTLVLKEVATEEELAGGSVH